MIWKNALKYPMLVIGITFFIIFITNPKTEDYWNKISRRYIPSTCDAVKDRIQPKAPKGWKIKCPTIHQLKITTKNEVKKLSRQSLYKELANNLVKIGQLSNLETLAHLKQVEFLLTHSSLEITAFTDGQALVELTQKKLPQDIAKHLKLTVKIKETRK